MSRYKPIGWRNDPYRHSLASKGIKSRLSMSGKVDFFEPFRGPEERSEVGRQMVDQKINSKMAEVDRYMESCNVSFDDRKRIVDNGISPLVERFRAGKMSGDDFDRDVDDLVRNHSRTHSRDFRPFAWGDEEKPSKHGSFNFIDKAREN
jgi:hypothetical protein